jgi:hypothetical protein
VVSSATVPEVVITPPVKPVPAVIEVTVPDPPPPPAVPQQTALLPLLISTWPAVPQEPAQSMIPAPGLMALVLSPVNQRAVLEYPMAKVQVSVVQVVPTLGPIKTF